MCTSGVVSTVTGSGEKLVLLGKTLDFTYDSGFWHALITNQGGYDVLGVGMTPQIAVNSGLNKAGLGVCLSYFDYRGPFTDDPAPKPAGKGLKWSGDDRGVANAAILAKCTTVQEAIEFMYDFVPQNPHMPGGNHMFADANGEIAVFEHCDGQMNYQIYTAQGYTARGNNALIIQQGRQRELPELVQKDRNDRCSTMEKCVAEIYRQASQGLAKDQAIEMMKQAFSTHGPDGADKPGAICAHGMALAGGRSSLPLPNWTLTAVVFDVIDRKMVYSIGNPCLGNWRELSF